MSVATRRDTVRKVATTAYNQLPHPLQRVAVVGSSLVATVHSKWSRLPLPVTVAYAINAVQTAYPTCKACYHPIIVGKTHGGWCAKQRSMECSTLFLAFVALWGGARNFFVCDGRSCTHPVPRPGQLCDCCQRNIVSVHPIVKHPAITVVD